MVRLARAPKNRSPVPHLTSIHSTPARGHIIRDLLQYYQPKSVFDPMSGSGTCRDVCRELGIPCFSGDIRNGFDCSDVDHVQRLDQTFDFIWL